MIPCALVHFIQEVAIDTFASVAQLLFTIAYILHPNCMGFPTHAKWPDVLKHTHALIDKKSFKSVVAFCHTGRGRWRLSCLQDPSLPMGEGMIVL